jgi:hypothetical protein
VLVFLFFIHSVVRAGMLSFVIHFVVCGRRFACLGDTLTARGFLLLAAVYYLGSASSLLVNPKKTKLS